MILNSPVATVLTACGETRNQPDRLEYQPVATVLTACGIETLHRLQDVGKDLKSVATALTACGIETFL